MKNKIIFTIILAAIILYNQSAKADNRFYFGGGYQYSKLGFASDEPKGSYQTTIEQTDPDLTTTDTTENPDGTHTTTTTTTTEFVTKDNVGAYLKYDKYYQDIFKNFNVFTGIKITPNLAMEIGYFRQAGNKENKDSNQFIFEGKTTKIDSTLQIASLDFVISNNVFEEVDILDVFAMAGVSFISYKNSIDYYDNGIYDSSENNNWEGVGMNIGFGLEPKITKNISLRSSIKMTIVPGSDLLKYIYTGSVGLKISI